MILVLAVNSVGIIQYFPVLVDLCYPRVAIDIIHFLQIITSQQIDGFLDVGSLLPCVLLHDPVCLVVDNPDNKCI